MKYFLISLLLFFTLSFAHPFYLSVCDLKFNPVSQKIEGTLKVFTNDLEDALKRLGNKTIDLIHSKNKKEDLLILNQYLIKRLSLFSNDKGLSYQLLGYETEEESTWIYFETSFCSLPKNLKVENSLLYDFLKEQMNLINLEVEGQKKSWKLTYPEKQVIFQF